MAFNATEFGFKPCPKCGGTLINCYAFSIVPDCRITCENCNFEIESEVSWEGCEGNTHKEKVLAHDEKCCNHLRELWNNYKSN